MEVDVVIALVSLPDRDDVDDEDGVVSTVGIETRY